MKVKRKLGEKDKTVKMIEGSCKFDEEEKHGGYRREGGPGLIRTNPSQLIHFTNFKQKKKKKVINK